MDQELKQYLEAMEARTDRKLESMATLIVEVKESLERQISTGLESVTSRLDAQGIRLDRQAAMIQTGSRWTNRMIKWSEKIDVVLEKNAHEIGGVKTRLDKLEGKKAS